MKLIAEFLGLSKKTSQELIKDGMERKIRQGYTSFTKSLLNNGYLIELLIEQEGGNESMVFIQN